MSYPASVEVIELSGALVDTGGGIYAYTGDWYSTDDTVELDVVCQTANTDQVTIEEGMSIVGASPYSVNWINLPATTGHSGPGGSTYNCTSSTVHLRARYFRIVVVGASGSTCFFTLRRVGNAS
jgi:hypothetical protein